MSWIRRCLSGRTTLCWNKYFMISSQEARESVLLYATKRMGAMHSTLQKANNVAFLQIALRTLLPLMGRCMPMIQWWVSLMQL